MEASDNTGFEPSCFAPVQSTRVYSLGSVGRGSKQQVEYMNTRRMRLNLWIFVEVVFRREQVALVSASGCVDAGGEERKGEEREERGGRGKERTRVLVETEMKEGRRRKGKINGREIEEVRKKMRNIEFVESGLEEMERVRGKGDEREVIVGREM